MVRTTTTIGTDRHTDDVAYREFTAAQVTGFRDLCHQLVQTRINIIGKLYFYNWFQPHSTHTHGRTDDISLLDSGIEYTRITKLLCQCCSLSEYTTDTATHILSVKQGFRVLAHHLFNGMQCRINHHYFFTTFRHTGTALFSDLQRSKYMIRNR
ncbi:hypothetical protein D3C86_1221760 [compost metagenome]